MNYGAVKKTDVANGPGIRVSLFVSGCTHGCRGCFNKEAWDFSYGEEYTSRTQEEILQALAPGYIRGLSVLGGEPFEPQNAQTVLELLEKVRERYPEKDIWCYTGYEYERDLLQWAAREGHEEAVPERGRSDAQRSVVTKLLALIDVLVDGEFVEEKKNLRLAFRGSENQRLIDVKASRREDRTICLREEDKNAGQTR